MRLFLILFMLIIPSLTFADDVKVIDANTYSVTPTVTPVHKDINQTIKEIQEMQAKHARSEASYQAQIDALEAELSSVDAQAPNPTIETLLNADQKLGVQTNTIVSTMN